MKTLVHKINKTYQGKLLSFALIVEVILILYVLFESFYPFKPITFYDDKFQVVAVDQDSFSYRLRGYKSLDIPANLDRVLICENEKERQLSNLMPAVSTTPPSEFDHIIDIELPKNVIRPATCYMRETGTFKHSVFRDVILSMETKEFEIQ